MISGFLEWRAAFGDRKLTEWVGGRYKAKIFKSTFDYWSTQSNNFYLITIRADEYFEHRLIQQVLQYWLKRLISRRNLGLELIDSFHSRFATFRKQAIIGFWKKRVYGRQQDRLAVEFHRKMLFMRGFLIWQRRQRVIIQMESVSQIIHHSQIRLQAFSWWISYLKQVRVEKQSIQDYRRASLLRKSYVLWSERQAYTESQKVLAGFKTTRDLCKAAFQIWTFYLSHKRSLKAHLLLLFIEVKKHKAMKMKKIFMKWKATFKETRRLRLFVQYRNSRREKSLFLEWKQLSTSRSLYTELFSLLSRAKAKQRRSQYFLGWKSRWLMTCKADQVYRKSRIKSYFRLWNLYQVANSILMYSWRTFLPIKPYLVSFSNLGERKLKCDFLLNPIPIKCT